MAKGLNKAVREKNGYSMADEIECSKYIQMIDDRLSQNEFLQGPNIQILDLALFGMLYRFARGEPLPFIKECFAKSPKLLNWYNKMEQQVGNL